MGRRTLLAIVAGAILAAGILIGGGRTLHAENAEARAVLAANEAFYQAFRDRDMAAMDAIWARTDSVAVIHPGWHGLNGRKPVMNSWRTILGNPAAPKVRSVKPRAHVYGTTAFVVGYEVLGNGVLIATNIFVREDGAWKMVHHQAGPTAGVPDDKDGQPT